MKRIRIVQAAIVAAVVVVMASCSSGREYQTGYYPHSQSSVSLILGPGPGLVVASDPYGRYYYRDPYGRTYWRGYDNRYYLDRKNVSRSYYQHRQYNDWRRYNNNNGRRR